MFHTELHHISTPHVWDMRTCTSAGGLCGCFVLHNVAHMSDVVQYVQNVSPHGRLVV